MSLYYITKIKRLKKRVKELEDYIKCQDKAHAKQIKDLINSKDFNK